MIIHYSKTVEFSCEINDAEHALFKRIHERHGRISTKILMISYLRVRNDLDFVDAVTIVNKYLDQF